MTRRSRSIAADNPGGIIQTLFRHQDAVNRHLNAPMLDQRQTYLARLSALGRSRDHIIARASTLCHVLNSSSLNSLITVTEEDIAEAAARWRGSDGFDATPHSKMTTREFRSVARCWYRFLGLYTPRERDQHPYKSHLLDFVETMRSELGYLNSTILAWRSPTRLFLHWITSQELDLASVALSDIDSFISERRAAGVKNRTIACDCQALRAFFLHAKRRGWNQNNLGKTIRTPRFKTQACSPKCPSWGDVRRVIETLDTSRASDCRSKAIFLLASVYGLRCSEIAYLKLDDFDWYHEVMTVRRVKNGKIQQFPIQFEVGEAIIDYLRKFRPSSKHRNLILTLTTPYRPIVSLASSMSSVLSAPRMMGRPCGLHSLRHACATELLRRGTSLRAIADLLGHNTLRAVSVYAHCNIVALQKVGDFSLKGIS